MNQLLWTPHQSRPVGVQFKNVLDRSGHRLLLGLEDASLAFADSIEGLDHEPWPRSPVLQEVEACPLGQGRQGIVAVGLGGTSHWSMAIEGDLNDGLKFDLACRVSDSPAFLGSSYLALCPIEQISESSVALTVDESQRLRVGLEVLQGQLTCAEADRQLTILADLVVDAHPATVRWQYRVFLFKN